ncbi:MAG: hypothetical protein SGPRY_003976 [Prymnesium sp.]
MVAAASHEVAQHAQKLKGLNLKTEKARAERELQELEAEVESQRAERERFQRDSEKTLADTPAKLEARKLAEDKESLEAGQEELERELAEERAQSQYLEEKKQREKHRLEGTRDSANQMREAVKETSYKRLQAKKELEERVTVLASEYNELSVQFNELCKKQCQLGGMSASKQGKRGGGMQLQFQHRLAILEQHANGTPSSAIGRNIVSVVRKGAPWLEPVEPTRREIQQIGVRVEDTPGGQLQDVLKAAYLSTHGGTSVAVTSEIEDKCFLRLRELLRLWGEYHQRMFPEARWTGPDPNNYSLHRLAGGGALMSDTCNGARKTKRLLTALIQKQAEAALRDASYGDQPEIRIVVRQLEDELKQFSSWERMTTDYEQLFRAVHREFHQGGRHYKGKGADFASWMLDTYPDAFYMHIKRADGGRQLVEYLHSHVFAAEHKNILEDFLYQTLMTTQYVSMSRAN